MNASLSLLAFGAPGPLEVVLLLLLGAALLRFFSRRLSQPPQPLAQIGGAIAPPPRRKIAKPACGWYLPCGIIALILAVLGFFASAAVAGEGDVFVGVFAGLLNPFFFVGLPLGIYWLSRANMQRAASAAGEGPNRRLTHCADCGRHVSRLAVSCPHCGRPLGRDASDPNEDET